MTSSLHVGRGGGGAVKGMDASRTGRIAVIGVVGIFALLSSVVAATTPAWEAADEPDHVLNAETLVSGHWYRMDKGAGLQAHQAPLYYVFLAEILGPLNLAPDAGPHQNPFVTWPGHPWRLSVAPRLAETNTLPRGSPGETTEVCRQPRCRLGTTPPSQRTIILVVT